MVVDLFRAALEDASMKYPKYYTREEIIELGLRSKPNKKTNKQKKQ